MEQATAIFDQNKCDLFNEYYNSEFSYRISKTHLHMIGDPKKMGQDVTKSISSEQLAEALHDAIVNYEKFNGNTKDVTGVELSGSTVKVPLDLAHKISDSKKDMYLIYGAFYQNTCAQVQSNKPKAA